ncbi:hypothetical protein HFP51_00955 [Parasphingopyxis sp. CP4]|uniref:hypothetical protein n=1 Tax=Parasphingopyxis sp. CP4 TaxID=2724527 RepID=UPI0015A0992E|nr:hypothetical protein [Parasphingopyxis sp. CP4]QLC20875.1 hypothetical protein HFP51_00955 [Parasphingopyxis sp. CP4]
MKTDLHAPDRLAWLCFWTLKISNGLLGALFLLSVVVLAISTPSESGSGVGLVSIVLALVLLASYACVFFANVFLKIDTRHQVLTRVNGVVLTIAAIFLLIVFSAGQSPANNWWMVIIFLWPGLNLILIKTIRRRSKSQIHETFA